MEKDFNLILDECLDRINRGENPEACLADYPGYARQLAPYLLTAAQTRQLCSFTPSDEAMRTNRQRLYAALGKKRVPSLWQRLFGFRPVWITAAAVIVIAIVSYFVFLSGSTPPANQNIAQPAPGSTPVAPLASTAATTSISPSSSTATASATETSAPASTQYIAAASPDGNFAFLVSDDVNAIADFSSVVVYIDHIGLLQDGSSGKWIEFTPETREFDLSLLPGEKTLELWRGTIPEGDYSKVFIYVNRVTGVLLDSGETTDIKVPGNKLQMDLSFQVSSDSVTSFTYDMTIIDSGNGKKGSNYHLKPQISESSATKKHR